MRGAELGRSGYGGTALRGTERLENGSRWVQRRKSRGKEDCGSGGAPMWRFRRTMAGKLERGAPLRKAFAFDLDRTLACKYSE